MYLVDVSTVRQKEIYRLSVATSTAKWSGTSLYQETEDEVN